MVSLLEVAMNSRQRVLTALDHKGSDRVPFDLGGTVITGIAVRAYHNSQGNVAPENIMAIWEALQEFAVYRQSCPMPVSRR
jgi:hypothetical protein